MLFTKLATNLKGPDKVVEFAKYTGITGLPQSGKSRLGQAITIAITGALPRLGRKCDIIELAAPGADMIYARLFSGKEQVAYYEAPLANGKVREVRHFLIPHLDAEAVASWSSLIELGDMKCLEELYRAFGEGSAFEKLRGCTPEQQAILDELVRLDSVDMLNAVESRGRAAQELATKTSSQIATAVNAENELSRFTECPHCHGTIVATSMTNTLRATLRAAEDEKRTCANLAKDMRRVFADELSESAARIEALVNAVMPLNMLASLTVSRDECRWRVASSDGVFRGSKVACGTERAALGIGLTRAWARRRTELGLQNILLLDDGDMTGLSILDRAELLRDIMSDDSIGQVVAISADDIFPTEYKVIEV